MNNCKSLPQSTQPHLLPGLTSHLPTSNTKRHMLDFLPCSCCYLSPGCLPLASYLLKISSAHFYLEVSMSLPHKHNWTTSPFPGIVEDQGLSVPHLKEQGSRESESGCQVWSTQSKRHGKWIGGWFGLHASKQPNLACVPGHLGMRALDASSDEFLCLSFLIS